MTCAHVLGLIDAGPFADYPPAHLDAAWQHARQCATCGAALAASARLARDLAALAQPAPPPDLTATILARIARLEPAGTDHATAARSVPHLHSIRDWSTWATVLGGLGAAFAIVWFTPYDASASIETMLARFGGITAGRVAMPATIAGAMVLAAGLVTYVAGLFATLGDGPTKNRASP